MKKSKFAEAQLGGRSHHFCPSSGRHWTVVAEVCRNRTEAEENQQLKQLVADLSLDKQMLQDVIKKSFNRAAER